MIIEVSIIALFSVIQSILGVGLLVFGTPTLILLGYSFDHTLSILLPSSLVISLLQLRSSHEHIADHKKDIFFLSIPFLAIGLFIVFQFEAKLNLKYFISFILIFSGLLRLSPKISDWIFEFIKKYKKLYLVLLGFIHGLTNLGGGLLTLYASSSSKEKVKVRGTIAFGYALFAIIQLLLTYFYHPDVFNYKILIYIFISGVIYLLIGNRIFHFISQNVFTQLITGLILSYGILMLIF